MGRPKGSLNKKTIEQVAAVEATGETPLEYMLRVMRDREQPKDRRDDMAKAAAPYVHAKLAAVEHSGSVAMTHEDALEQLDEQAKRNLGEVPARSAVLRGGLSEDQDKGRLN
jgi:hypothetical protein